MSKSFILSNSLRVADPDLLDLGVGLCRPETAFRMPVPRGSHARFLTFRQSAPLSKTFSYLQREKSQAEMASRSRIHEEIFFGVVPRSLARRAQAFDSHTGSSCNLPEEVFTARTRFSSPVATQRRTTVANFIRTCWNLLPRSLRGSIARYERAYTKVPHSRATPIGRRLPGISVAAHTPSVGGPPWQPGSSRPVALAHIDRRRR